MSDIFLVDLYVISRLAYLKKNIIILMVRLGVCGKIITVVLQSLTQMDVDVIENILNIPSTPEVIVAYARIDAPVDAKVHIQPGALQIIKDSDHFNSTDYLQVVRYNVRGHEQRYKVHIISNPYINEKFS
jgi:hypothetical protein